MTLSCLHLIVNECLILKQRHVDKDKKFEKFCLTENKAKQKSSKSGGLMYMILWSNEQIIFNIALKNVIDWTILGKSFVSVNDHTHVNQTHDVWRKIEENREKVKGQMYGKNG